MFVSSSANCISSTTRCWRSPARLRTPHRRWVSDIVPRVKSKGGKQGLFTQAGESCSRAGLSYLICCQDVCTHFSFLAHSALILSTPLPTLCETKDFSFLFLQSYFIKKIKLNKRHFPHNFTNFLIARLSWNHKRCLVIKTAALQS